jgi:hypothetical protein
MECVTTASALVMFNGSPTNEFPLCRGLHQGDSLPPFLFLLVAEGLNVMFTATVHVSLFLGYKIGEASLVCVSHLQFANDTLILGEKNWEIFEL